MGLDSRRRRTAHFTLAQVVQFKIQQPVKPGATIESEVESEKIMGTLAQFAVTLRIGLQEVARGRIVLSAAWT